MPSSPSFPSVPRQRLKEAAQACFELQLDEDVLDRLEKFARLLLHWNQRVSLTGASSLHEVLLDHVLDSLAATAFVPEAGDAADLGSGAGFPGIPLAIVKPGTAFALVEPRRKRANFLREAIRELHLKNASVIESRAEEMSSRYAQTFDLVTARALGALEQFLRMAAPLLRPGATAIAFKGPAVHSELSSVPAGFSSPELHWYTLPNGSRHCLVLCRRA